MYLTRLKALVVESLQTSFADSPNPDMRAVQVSIEYPIDRQAYPGIWVDYDDKDSLVIAGVDHKEYVEVSGKPYEVTRWKFAGEVSLTIVALSSMERDNIYDELVRIYAFGAVEDPTGVDNFRHRIENNDFLAMLANFDELRPGGNAAGQGTPWGTDEVIYERTASFSVEGEFVSDPHSDPKDPLYTGGLLKLSAVKAQGYRVGDAVVQFPDETLTGPTQPFNPTHWH